jgi:hypothetical protein
MQSLLNHLVIGGTAVAVKDLIEQIAKALVDNPDEVAVRLIEAE